MPLHPKLTSGYEVLILYTQQHTLTFQIDVHTQDKSEEKKRSKEKFTLAAKKKQTQKN